MEPDEFSENHPLHDHDSDLETHADYLRAYADVLENADPDEVHGAMVVLYSKDGCDTLPTVSTDVDPRSASLWMLGNHIHHLASSAQAAGGTATMHDVADDAIQYVTQHAVQPPE